MNHFFQRNASKSNKKQAPESIFGIHAVTEAILAGKHSIAKVWIKQASKHPGHQKISQLTKAQGIPCSQVPLIKLNRLSKGKHQGVIALLAPIEFHDLDHVLQATYAKGKDPLILLLDQIQDMRNLGAIVRTAVATQVDAIVVGTKHTTPITTDAMKTSAGALAHIAICRTENLTETLTYLQKNGLQIIASTEKGEKTIYETNFQQPTAIIIGSENKGIAPTHLKMATERVQIPMFGPVGSLNAATAASILLYEAIRQKTYLSKPTKDKGQTTQHPVRP